MRHGVKLELLRTEEARRVKPDRILTVIAPLKQESRPNDHPSTGKGLAIQ